MLELFVRSFSRLLGWVVAFGVFAVINLSLGAPPEAVVLIMLIMAIIALFTILRGSRRRDPSDAKER